MRSRLGGHWELLGRQDGVGGNGRGKRRCAKGKDGNGDLGI